MVRGLPVVCAASCALSALVVAPPARADGPAYQLDPQLDVAMVLVGGGVATGFFFLEESGRGPSCAPVCDPANVNAFDRPAAGNYDERWSSLGDVGVFTTLAFVPTLVLLDEGLEDGLNDDLVIVEAALMSAALQVSLSYAIDRPRPRVYGTEAPQGERTDANAARSFYSGHVAETMAVTVAGFRTFQRLDEPVLAWTTLGSGAAGSAFVGVARVASGGHFPSDVLVGAAIGTGVGLALPALHDEPVRVVPTAMPGGGGATIAGVLR